MSLNWKEIDQCLKEMDLEGCHIQKIRQPDFQSLVFDTYKPGQRARVLISLLQGKTRIHFLSQKIQNEVKLQRFAQFLRARILGGRITGIRQFGSDRIIRMEISRADETTILWIRLWSNAANIIATDPAGTVLDAFYRRPGRDETSGGAYAPEETEVSDDGRFSLRELPGDGSFQEKIEVFYGSKRTEELLTQFRAQALRIATSAEGRLSSALSNLEKRYAKLQRGGRDKEIGDLIMSHLHLIAPGAREVTVSDYYRGGEDLKISLDPKLSGGQNADLYYEKYKRAKSGRTKLEEEIANHRTLLKKAREEVTRWETEEDLDALKAFIRSQPKQSAKTDGPETPGLRYFSGGFRILVGRTAKENDALLRRHVRGNDLWLHTRDVPGGYVFIKTVSGKSVPLEVLLDAGNLAVYHSKARTSGAADLYYTHVKYLRRAKEGPLGLVLPTQEKNLHIKLEKERLDRILGAD